MSVTTLNSWMPSMPSSWPRGPAGGGVDQRGAGVLDAIEQEEIVLRAAAGDREHAAHRGVRRPHAAGTLVGVVHRRGIQCEQLVVAASVERKLLHLARIDQAGDLVGGKIDGGGNVLHGDGLAADDLERQRQVQGLAHGERDAGALVAAEAAGVDADGVAPDGDGRAVNVPTRLVVSVRCTPMSSLWTTTVALGMTAPVGSVTVPEIVPLTTWA